MNTKLLCFEWSPPWHSIHPIWKSIWHIYLAFHLACLLTFYLAYLLTFYLAYLLTFYLAYLLTFYLAFYLAYLLAFSPAVEVRQGTLGVDGRGWGPAGNTGRGWSRLRSGREHCARLAHSTPRPAVGWSFFGLIGEKTVCTVAFPIMNPIFRIFREPAGVKSLKQALRPKLQRLSPSRQLLALLLLLFHLSGSFPLILVICFNGFDDGCSVVRNFFLHCDIFILIAEVDIIEGVLVDFPMGSFHGGFEGLTLGVDGRGWGPAGNTWRGFSRLRSGREHLAWILAVEVRRTRRSTRRRKAGGRRKAEVN